MLNGKSILLIISGGIAAYKSLELIRLLRKNGANVRCILSKGGAQFITPLSVASLSEHEVYTDLWSLKDETEMGHIRLSREADLIVVAPASANMIAKMAHGMADDLASTCLLAANKPIMICPAMNQMMWSNVATQDNIETLQNRGVIQCGPAEGDMACGETGLGRMAEPEDILTKIETHFNTSKPLSGKTALVTAGPTFEPIDPVRFIGNRSSGKQGFEIAKALADQGASVKLVTGPTHLKSMACIETLRVETADEMWQACEAALPYDIAVCAAAVSDWRAETQASQKLKKQGSNAPELKLTQTPDILAQISKHSKRPGLVIGFAAETENLEAHATQKRLSKGCDWIVANNVAEHDVFGSDHNKVMLITKDDAQDWPKASKEMIARKLVQAMINHFQTPYALIGDAAE